MYYIYISIHSFVFKTTSGTFKKLLIKMGMILENPDSIYFRMSTYSTYAEIWVSSIYIWSTPIQMDSHNCLIGLVLETINLYHGKSSEDFPKESIDMSYSQGQLIFLSSLLTNPLIVPWLSMMESFPVDFLIIVPFWWGLCIYIYI